MAFPQITSPPQALAEVIVNESLETLEGPAIFGKRHAVTTGLVWGYHGGYYNGNTIADGTVTMTDNATNYIVVLRSTGVVSVSTSSTNSLDPLYAKLYTNVCAGGVVTTEGDKRWDANGLFLAPGGASGDASTNTSSSVDSEIALFSGTGGKTLKRATGSGLVKVTSGVFGVASAGTDYQAADADLTTIAGLTATTDNFLQAKSSAWASRTVAQVSADLQGTGLISDAVGFRYIPANSQSADYTTVAADSGKSIDHPSGDANARTFTIDSNANVAYPIGTTISFSNMTVQVVTIAITSDTLYLAGAGTTGSRSLAQYGTATARKIASTAWMISGVGLT